MSGGEQPVFEGIDCRSDGIWLGTFIESANKTETVDELFKLIEATAASLGFEYVAYGALSNCRRIASGAESAPAICLNYPEEWRKHYFENCYQEVDPVVTRTASIDRPYIWSDWRKKGILAPREQKVLDEASDAGLKEGMGIPLHGPFGRVAVVSFASKYHTIDAVGVLPKLRVIASQFHACFGALKPASTAEEATPTLTPQQKKCLIWVSHGKSSWDISAILGISENTVNFHLKAILRKLSTSSRTVAVVKAIRLGLIII
jgi:DNA-binding CsgD family transcriptional regulator